MHCPLKVLEYVCLINIVLWKTHCYNLKFKTHLLLTNFGGKNQVMFYFHCQMFHIKSILVLCIVKWRNKCWISSANMQVLIKFKIGSFKRIQLQLSSLFKIFSAIYFPFLEANRNTNIIYAQVCTGETL